MRITKAIKLLNTAKEGWPFENSGDYYKALELGLEALKQVKYLREIHILHDHELLLGEGK
ncbi:hypothetical protein LCGC14_0674770 [marine sediment metagenome]|uniref:Uncharacterized protein n=1 Tax=marine sediment metagenome TaxID=412755 RepID=A0A0F9QQ40_9ZZZZ